MRVKTPYCMQFTRTLPASNRKIYTISQKLRVKFTRRVWVQLIKFVYRETKQVQCTLSTGNFEAIRTLVSLSCEAICPLFLLTEIFKIERP